MTNAQKIGMLLGTVAKNPYIPVTPTPRQSEFLVNTNYEVLYGGAAGGGKSAGLLMAALQFVEYPEYHALLLRKTYADMLLANSILALSHEWLNATDARWHPLSKSWTFPPYNSSLTFGHLQNERHKYRYQGSAFNFVGFDELTQFSESQYMYLHSRIRKSEKSTIPRRMRAGTNPGGDGHGWVKRRWYLPEGTPDRDFIPAKLIDNPHLNREEYAATLNNLPSVLREQLLNGDWTVADGGYMFDRSWFEIIMPEQVPRPLEREVRFWDLASTAVSKSSGGGSKNPCYTAGIRMGIKDGIYYILDIRRFRESPKGVEDRIRNTAISDTRKIPIFIEEEGGSGGKFTIDTFQRRVLQGFIVAGRRPRGDKTVRANVISSAAEAGNVKIVRGKWNEEFLDEGDFFPYSDFKDQIDALSGATNELCHERSGFLKRN